MTEHLPECWATYPSDPPAWCICDELRACEGRVLAAAREAVEALPFFIPDPDGVMYKGGMSDPVGLRVWLDRNTALSVIDELKESNQ